jgi:hypothetical protein
VLLRFHCENEGDWIELRFRLAPRIAGAQVYAQGVSASFFGAGQDFFDRRQLSRASLWLGEMLAGSGDKVELGPGDGGPRQPHVTLRIVRLDSDRFSLQAEVARQFHSYWQKTVLLQTLGRDELERLHGCLHQCLVPQAELA